MITCMVLLPGAAEQVLIFSVFDRWFHVKTLFFALFTPKKTSKSAAPDHRHNPLLLPHQLLVLVLLACISRRKQSSHHVKKVNGDSLSSLSITS